MNSDAILGEIRQYLSDTLQMELLNGYPYPHVASEALFNSIETVVERSVSQMHITVQGLFYAKFVNQGRPAGAKGIPIDTLIEWVRRRKLDLRGNDEKSAAFAIQASIKRWGIAPTNFIDNAALEIEKSTTLETKIEKMMSGFIDAQLQDMFNKLKTE